MSSALCGAITQEEYWTVEARSCRCARKRFGDVGTGVTSRLCDVGTLYHHRSGSRCQVRLEQHVTSRAKVMGKIQDTKYTEAIASSHTYQPTEHLPAGCGYAWAKKLTTNANLTICSYSTVQRSTSRDLPFSIFATNDRPKPHTHQRHALSLPNPNCPNNAFAIHTNPLPNP